MPSLRDLNLRFANLHHQAGVTLIELLVSMSIAAILMAAIYSVFEAQTRGQASQQAMAEMQQEVRTAIQIMAKEIRSAGADPLQAVNTGFLNAAVGDMRFTRDITGGETDGIDNDNDGTIDEADEAAYYDGDINNDANEDIHYALTNDVDGDGVADGSPCNLGRETCNNNPPAQAVCGGLQPLAYNIDVLNFVYLGRQGVVIGAPVAANQLANIRAVQITIVARSGEKIRSFLKKYMDTTNYTNQQGTVILPAPNDYFRRIRVTTTVTCRNLSTGM